MTDLSNSLSFWNISTLSRIYYQPTFSPGKLYRKGIWTYNDSFLFTAISGPNVYSTIFMPKISSTSSYQFNQISSSQLNINNYLYYPFT